MAVRFKRIAVSFQSPFSFQPNEVALGTAGDRRLGGKEVRSGKKETLSKMPMREPRQKTISTVRQKATLF